MPALGRWRGAVGVRADVAVLHRAVPLARQRVRPAGATRRTISSSTVSASPTHRCLAPGTPTTSACGTAANRARASSGPQVVVELGHQRDHRLAGLRPARAGPRRWREPQRRREQDRPGHAPGRSRSAAPGRCRTTSRPARSSGSSANSAYSIAAATSNRSPHRVVEAPSLVPRTLDVPRVLNRSTARSASAGSRQAALRNTWLSIIPPWVGSGCRQTRVATGSRSAGSASSPTSRRPSAVCSSMSSRRAGQDRVGADRRAHGTSLARRRAASSGCRTGQVV